MSDPTATRDCSVTKQEKLYKILVIGEFGVGKTSFIRRYTEGCFSPNYKLTIGVDFALKTLEWDAQTRIILQLWDIAGHERFGHMTRVYYKYAIAAFIVFDLARYSSFEAIQMWLNDLNSKVWLENELPIPVILLANKCDLEEQEVTQENIEAFCHENNIIGYFLTSAKGNINVDEAVHFLVNHILSQPLEQQEAYNPANSQDGTQEIATVDVTFLEDPKKQKCCDT